MECLFVFQIQNSLYIEMNCSLSPIQNRFRKYRLLARTNIVLSNEIEAIKRELCDLPGSAISKLKNLQSEVFSEVNWGRLIVFLLSLAEQLALTEEEWKQLFVFLIPVLNQVTG